MVQNKGETGRVDDFRPRYDVLGSTTRPSIPTFAFSRSCFASQHNTMLSASFANKMATRLYFVSRWCPIVRAAGSHFTGSLRQAACLLGAKRELATRQAIRRFRSHGHRHHLSFFQLPVFTSLTPVCRLSRQNPRRGPKIRPRKSGIVLPNRESKTT